MHSENKSKHSFFSKCLIVISRHPPENAVLCLFSKIKSRSPDIRQPGKQTLPANRSPTIVKKIDKTNSTYEDPTTVLLGNLYG